MYEQLIELLAYAQSATRHKWLALIVAWIVSVGGWIFVSHMPDQYEADARVLVDAKSVLQPFLEKMTIEPNIAEKGRLMAKLMFTRPNLDKIAESVDLYASARDERAKEKLRLGLLEAMSITGEKTDERSGNNFFTISAVDTDPRKATKMVQVLLTIFVEQTLEHSREESRRAGEFLDQQIKEYEERLREAEKAREVFKRNNFGLLPEGGSDLYTRLNMLTSQLDETRMALQEAVQRRDEIKRNLENEQPMFMDSALEKRIQALQSRLDELLVRFTKTHPDVIALKKSIADLQKLKKRQEQTPSVTNEDEIGGVDKGRANLVFQQMKIALGEAEANVASISSRAKAYEEKIAQLKQQMDARLKVETELQSLNRDYDTIKAKYEGLLQSRETALLSEKLEKNPETPKFHIVDPPQEPIKPSKPNRLLLSAAVFVGSVGVGIGLAVLLTLLRPTFSTIKNIREIAGLPVLGSVSMNWMPEIKKRKRRELIRFVALFASLFVVFVGVLILEVQGINLHHLSL